MFDKPIESIQQAKEYFMSMGCSHFHMAREYPQRYKEYEKLNISKQMETEWKIEQIEGYYETIIKNKEEIELWVVHSNMSDLVEALRTETTLQKMLVATEHIRDKVPFKDRVIVSETIIGRKDRKYRSGLIYLAYDLNNIPIAKSFVELSQHFAIYVEQKSRDIDRCQQATELCNEIKLELKL